MSAHLWAPDKPTKAAGRTAVNNKPDPPIFRQLYNEYVDRKKAEEDRK